MLGKIIAINESIVTVSLTIDIYSIDGLIGKNVIFKDKDLLLDLTVREAGIENNSNIIIFDWLIMKK